MTTLYFLIESPFPPDLGALYQKLGIAAERFDSARNLHRALQRFAPQAKVIVFMHPREEDHIGKLLELFPLHAVLAYPVSEQAMQAALQTPT